MKLATDEADVVARVLRWAEADDRPRAALLTSSRSRPDAPRDILSDYDVALLVTDPMALARDKAWLAEIGRPLLRVRDADADFGLQHQNVMVLFADGAKIDFTLWPLELPARITAAGALPGEFDGGFRVLLDKDGLTGSWPPPTGTAYIPSSPTAEEFQALIEEFWFVSTYVAKYLWRGEFIPARVIFDYELKYLIVRRLLEWRAEIDRGWTVQPGFFGRGLRRYLDAETWDEFTATYAGPDPDQTWAALFRTIALFRRAAIGVGSDLGYAYPHDTDRQLMDYLRQIEALQQHPNVR